MKAIAVTMLISLTLFGGTSLTAQKAVTRDTENGLVRLVEGNKRFVRSRLQAPRRTTARRTEVAKGQHPFAIILTCADSRVPPELLFDQGLGDLFVIRVAGNVLDDHALGSIEYAVEHLHAHLIVVMGHERCGAVDAAVKGGNVGGHIDSILEDIKPAVENSKNMPGNKLDNAIAENVREVVAKLKQCEPILSKEYKEKHITIVGMRYDLDTGQATRVK